VKWELRKAVIHRRISVSPITSRGKVKLPRASFAKALRYTCIISGMSAGVHRERTKFSGAILRCGEYIEIMRNYEMRNERGFEVRSKMRANWL
jgi:hypothetical protein